MDQARPAIKAHHRVPRNNLSLAAFCHEDYHAVLARNGITSKKHASYEFVALELSSGRFATLSLHRGATFEIGLETIQGPSHFPIEVCEADMIEVIALLGLDGEGVVPWQCGDALSWVPAGTEPKGVPHPQYAVNTPSTRLAATRKNLAPQLDALIDFIGRGKPAAPPKAPASETGLAWLRTALNGTAAELLAFYQHMDGARVFIDVDGAETCFFLLPIDAMGEEKRELSSWLHMNVIHREHEATEEVDEDGRLVIDGVPPWWNSAVVFGGFEDAPERLFVATEGAYAGAVFAYQHDGDYSVRAAASISELFLMLVDDATGFARVYA